MERAVLGEEVRDVLLREGARRRERHDRLQQWARRMEAAGFRGVPLSYAALRQGVDALGRCGVGGMREQRARGVPASVLEVVASLLGLGMAAGHRLGLWSR